ncbi:MAG: Ig-like domain-containing protein, partial [Clostridiales bacterium]|nr:Ig-like domain-containing protein [Clostridiales bacterium]
MKDKLTKRFISLLLSVVMLLGAAVSFPVYAIDGAGVPVGNIDGLDIKDTPDKRIFYSYTNNGINGGTGQGAGFSASVNWRSSSDSGIGYFQQNSNIPVNGWFDNAFDVETGGVYAVEFIYKGANGARGAVQNYLYADEFYTSGVFLEDNTAGDVLSMTGNTATEMNREASDPTNPNRILQNSTKAANNYFSYNIGVYNLKAVKYHLQSKMTSAGMPVAVAVMLVPYEAKPLVYISLDKTEMALDTTVNPSDTVTANFAEGWNNLKFTTSNENIAAVTQTGNTATITAVGIGTAVITATVSDGTTEKSVSMEVIVTKTPPVSVYPITVSMDLNDAVTTANAVATPAVGWTVTGWASANPEIATVNNNGVITAVGSGKTTVSATATNGERTEKADIAVTITDNDKVDLTYISGENQILSVNSEMRTITVASGTTAEQITSAIRHSSGNPVTASVADGILSVGYGEDTCDYTVIVDGDVTSTSIAAKKLEGFEVEMHGSNIGPITDGAITLIDGVARYFTIEESIALGKENSKNANKDTYTTEGQGGVPGQIAGRHQALRSAAEIIEQLESVNGTKQSYRILSYIGAEKSDELPVTGDILEVTAEDGITKKNYAITIEKAALSGKLYVTDGPSTIGTTSDLVLSYHAGQRTPEAEVAIQLPAGINATLENTFVNVIGRGEVGLDRFHLSRGENIDGVFERQDMHKLLGRFSVDYDYQTLGTVEITGDTATGKTITFKGLDLRPNNGADLVLRIEDVSFDMARAYNFSATMTTKAGTVKNDEPARTSFGVSSETDVLNVIHKVANLERVIYNENNFEDRVDPKLAQNPNELMDLHYEEGVRAGDYTGFEMTWERPEGATNVKIQHATGTIGQNGAVTLNGDWADLAEVGTAATSYTISGLNTPAYHRYRLLVTGGAQAGASNEIGFYSGKLDATLFGAVADGDEKTCPANKTAINNAINWLNSIGGGTLNFPANAEAYRTGTVYLKSNVYLYLEKGAFLDSAGGYMDDPESGWWCYRDYGAGTNNSEDPYANPDNFMSK